MDNHDDSNSAQGGTKTVSRFFLQLLYLPVTIFMASVNALGRAWSGTQSTTQPTVPGGFPGAGFSSAPPAGVGGYSTTPANVGGFSSTSASTTAALANTGFRNPNTKEISMGCENNQDLSGDELKTVVYSILFTKRDLEANLTGLVEDVINYKTNPASYGGLMLSRFTHTEFPWPNVWMDNQYPRELTPDEKTRRKNGEVLKITTEELEEDDQRYLTFEYKVVSRLPKNDADYDKRKTKALEKIASNTKPPIKVDGI